MIEHVSNHQWAWGLPNPGALVGSLLCLSLWLALTTKHLKFYAMNISLTFHAIIFPKQDSIIPDSCQFQPLQQTNNAFSQEPLIT